MMRSKLLSPGSSGWMGLLVCVIAVVAGGSQSVQADPLRELNGLRQQMTQLGKPALIIAGADWCVYCREMAQELAQSPELQPLKQQYAIMKVDVATPVWGMAKKALAFEPTGVPAVLVFRADGEQLYAKSGKPSDMKAFLERHLKEAGQPLTPQQSTQLNNDLKKIELALKRSDLQTAISLAMPHDVATSYAQPARAMTALQTQLETTFNEQLTSVRDALATGPDDFAVVMQLVELQTTATSHRPFTADVAELIEQVKAAESSAALLTQAELLQQADLLRADRKRGQAREQYEALIKQFPDSAVASVAQERLGQSSSEPDEPEMKPKPQKNGDETKAANYFRLAEQLRKVKSGMANDYYQKAIDAAPDSEIARKARALLN